MSYTFGGPDLIHLVRPRPETIVGTKDDIGVYLPVNATIRLLLRCPDSIAKAGSYVNPADFEPALRQACAEAMHGLTAGEFLVESVCVQEFQPGGA